MAHKLDIVLGQSLDFNIKFVEIVEQHPMIYRNEPRCSVTLQDMWTNIAETMGCGVSSKQLRTHWSELRSKYYTFAKQGAQDSPERIESYMHFLKPHLKLNRKRSKQSSYSSTVPKIARVESNGRKAMTVLSNHKKYLGNHPVDPDAMYLLSFLPRMRIMTGSQRMQFKIGAINLSGDILSCNETEI